MQGQQYFPLIEAAARQHGIEPALLAALLKQESGFNPNARSPVGALGIAQFMPGTAKGFKINPLDPKQAIPAAARYIAQGVKKYGSPEYALAAYNGGQGAVDYFKRHGGIYHNPNAPASSWANQTGNYVRTILANRGGFSRFFGNQEPTPQQPQAPMLAQSQPVDNGTPPLPAMPQAQNPNWWSLIDNTWQPWG